MRIQICLLQNVTLYVSQLLCTYFIMPKSLYTHYICADMRVFSENNSTWILYNCYFPTWDAWRDSWAKLFSFFPLSFLTLFIMENFKHIPKWREYYNKSPDTYYPASILVNSWPVLLYSYFRTIATVLWFRYTFQSPDHLVCGFFFG